MTTSQHTQVRFEWIRCNACGADDFRTQCTIEAWHVGKCGTCSLVYVNPMPFFQPDNFPDVTENFYYTEWQHTITSRKIALARREFKLQLTVLRRLRESAVAPGRFLDVGCGTGLGVQAAAGEGWEATGVDLDPTLVELGRKELKVNLECADLLACRLEPESFDFIRFKFVLEHLPNPRDVLRQARRLLRPDGLVLIVVPNETGLFNRLRLLYDRANRDRLGTLIPPHHLHAYAPGPLSRLLASAGLKPCVVHSRSPLDPAYGTFDQFEQYGIKKRLYGVLWTMTTMASMGSTLVAWSGAKPTLGLPARCQVAA